MRKTAVIILALILLLSVITSCDVDKDNESKTTQSNASDTSATSGSNESAGYVADIPDVNYDGLEFKIMTRLKPDAKYTEFGYDIETEAGVISEAVDKRNNTVEEQLGIDIVEYAVIDGQGDSVGTQLRMIEQANTDIYYIVQPQLYEVAQMAAEGRLYDMKKLSNLHELSEPWWDSFFIDATSINNKVFFVTGDMGFNTRDAINVCFFNKKYIEEYSLENPYELVNNNEWTIDVLIEWSKKISTDFDNDQKITYKDKYGLGGQNDLLMALFNGSGERLGEKDETGKPVVNVYNNRSVDVINKILELMQDKSHFVTANDYFGDPGYTVSPTELVLNAFMEGRSLFYFEILQKAEYLRGAGEELDLGILPIPMYSSNQDGYEHVINPYNGSAFAIPLYIGSENAEIASIVLEALSAESKNTVTPAYYDTALLKQKTRDIESQQMLDMIFSTVSVDLGHVYKWGNMGSALMAEMLNSGGGNFASLWDGIKVSVQEAVDATIEAYDSIEN
ncbi:MAG: hypothetical protein A2Y17_12025 [Clostridiales bacterium GWF2_38_85]|nr:MAG: hypothetical protein A2Y17_12025 [Clostridiales bacterium GWF2_38_85]HBL85428.1 hypothetical protein [Clostridiales bacterium]